MNRMNVKRRPRRGSAILLCFLAMAVVSVASIAIARSHRRLNIRRSVLLSSVQGKLIADALTHRQIAYQRINPSLVLAPIDKTLASVTGFENATAKIVSVDTTEQTLEMDISLYPGSPVIRRQKIRYGSGPTPVSGATPVITPTPIITTPTVIRVRDAF
ncbi:hypothetical protein [Rhodopirellula sp. SWK7]|uniref:hypothetical protein n=1 Tax=Rhodopirellula sp. SWK7 TaxID=595460 RepID=UPI0002BF1B9A|nr:hypothetical protein [Rhodopirellula sp. SWK7]EMI44390.1 signal peptide protein [Rhodopirellula sp. SWK7]